MNKIKIKQIKNYFKIKSRILIRKRLGLIMEFQKDKKFQDKILKNYH